MPKDNSNSPLDFLLLENNSGGALFGDSDRNEVLLPELDEMPEDFEAPEAEESLEHEAGESESEEAGETEEELGTLSDELNKLKDKITELKSEYPEDTNEEVAKALDDATSAIDLAVHHLGDIGEDLDSNKEDTPTQELEDMTMPGGEGEIDLSIPDELPEQP